jgi:hypothetical protein
VIASLGRVYALSGEAGKAREQLDRLTALSRNRYVSPFDSARIHSALARKDEAFAWLDQAYQDRSNRLAFIRVDPEFDALPSDPRFADLLPRMGL